MNVIQCGFICRDLRHDNVVRYYGAGYVKKSGGLKWIMVLELCKTCLKEYYLGTIANS